MELSDIKDQVTVRLTEQDKRDLLTVMQHDGTKHVSRALRDAVHRNANVIRKAGREAPRPTGGRE